MKRLAIVSIVLIGLIALLFVFLRAPDSKPPSNDKSTIGTIVFFDDEFFRAVQEGMRAAAADHGVELIEGNSRNDREVEVDLVETFAERGVDAVCVSPLSPKASVPALERAHDAGIEIVTFNSGLDAEFPSAFIHTKPEDLGSGTGKHARTYIENQLAGKAQVATLAFKALLPEISDARLNGFLQEIKDLPGVEIVARQDAWLVEDAIQRTSDILKSNPDVNIIYAANEGGTIGAVMAIEQAGKAGSVVVFGTDISPQMIDLLQSPHGILQAVTAQQPRQIGYQSIVAAIHATEGKSIRSMLVPALPIHRSDKEELAEWQAAFLRSREP